MGANHHDNPPNGAAQTRRGHPPRRATGGVAEVLLLVHAAPLNPLTPTLPSPGSRGSALDDDGGPA
jgi:hypothetical protein